jgi:hypothetical protein
MRARWRHWYIRSSSRHLVRWALLATPASPRRPTNGPGSWRGAHGEESWSLLPNPQRDNFPPTRDPYPSSRRIEYGLARHGRHDQSSDGERFEASADARQSSSDPRAIIDHIDPPVALAPVLPLLASPLGIELKLPVGTWPRPARTRSLAFVPFVRFGAGAPNCVVFRVMLDRTASPDP